MRDNLSSILANLPQEPVVIAQGEEEIAVLLSMNEYRKITAKNVQDFQVFCDLIGQKAQARGLTEEKLSEILSDE
jgi:hypothetical protein